MDRLGNMRLDSLKAFPKEEFQNQSTRILSNSSIPEIRVELSKSHFCRRQTYYVTFVLPLTSARALAGPLKARTCTLSVLLLF